MAAPTWINFAFLISLCLAVCSSAMGVPPIPPSNTANLDEYHTKNVKMAMPFASVPRPPRKSQVQGHKFVGIDEPHGYDSPCGYCGNYGCVGIPPPVCPTSCIEGRTDMLYGAIRELTAALKAKPRFSTMTKGGGGDDVDATSFVKQP